MSKRDKLDGVVRIFIEGKERKLRYDLAAQATLCEELTLEDMSALANALHNVSGQTIALFLWAGLKWNEPKLTQEQVSKWFVPLLPAIKAIHEATSLAMFGPDGPPERSEEPEADEDPKKPVNLSQSAASTSAQATA